MNIYIPVCYMIYCLNAELYFNWFSFCVIFQLIVTDKTQNLRRLEAQRNELNAKGKSWQLETIRLCTYLQQIQPTYTLICTHEWWYIMLNYTNKSESGFHINTCHCVLKIWRLQRFDVIPIYKHIWSKFFLVHGNWSDLNIFQHLFWIIKARNYNLHVI